MDRHILTTQEWLVGLGTREMKSASFPLVEVSPLLVGGRGALLLKVAWTLGINRKGLNCPEFSNSCGQRTAWGTFLEYCPSQQPMTQLLSYF